VVRPFTARTAFRRSIETPQYQQAIGCILAKHRAVFAANPAAALGARELALERVARIYSESMRRRVAGLAEIEDLRQRAERLSATLLPESPSAVAWGGLRRVSPLSLHWGFDRGTPIDRHYIEAFLAKHAADIRGVVLEVKDDGYTRRFGGVRVERVDVLDADARNGAATIVADLRCASNIPSDTYDCLVVTQTLHVIDDMPAAVSECHRVLRSGGVLLATLPCTSRIADPRDGSDCWRLTAGGARWLFSRSFDARALEVSTRGSVLTSVAFLHGISAEELDPHELAFDDPLFPLVVLVRAVKQPAAVKGSIAWQAE
jgi:SAM-dependent methyltransferase